MGKKPRNVFDLSERGLTATSERRTLPVLHDADFIPINDRIARCPETYGIYCYTIHCRYHEPLSTTHGSWTMQIVI